MRCGTTLQVTARSSRNPYTTICKTRRHPSRRSFRQRFTFTIVKDPHRQKQGTSCCLDVNSRDRCLEGAKRTGSTGSISSIKKCLRVTWIGQCIARLTSLTAGRLQDILVLIKMIV
uniref:(northern house mosquito) hypothetical protein n=1 Tax=Culex pipiens TaxID=7175 RepID=A0A8D8GIA3_CULPI